MGACRRSQCARFIPVLLTACALIDAGCSRRSWHRETRGLELSCGSGKSPHEATQALFPCGQAEAIGHTSNGLILACVLRWLR